MSLNEILWFLAALAGAAILAYALTILFLWCILSVAIGQAQSAMEASKNTPDQTEP